MKVIDDRRGAIGLKVLYLGIPCPICGLTGNVWGGAIEEETAANIREAFSQWRPEHGAWEHCIEAYSPRRLM